MPEMRQRRGGAKGRHEDDEPSREELIKQITEKLKETVKPVKRNHGITKDAQKVKDALDKDPHNLQLIWELGNAYANEERFDRSVNVLMRGWKRVSEIADSAARFDFLFVLCQASCRCKQFKQALAVLNDMQEPDDATDLRVFLVMSCQVFCHNNNVQKALKAFNRATADEDVDEVIGMFGSCMPALRKVGAYEAAKSVVDQRMETDEQRMKLSALEQLSEMREQLEGEVQPAKDQRAAIIVACVVITVLFVIGLLFRAELHSFSQMRKSLPDGK